MAAFKESDTLSFEVFARITIEGVFAQLGESEAKRTLNALNNVYDKEGRQGRIPSQWAKSFRIIWKEVFKGKKREKEMKTLMFQTGIAGGLTYHQACAVIESATGNNVFVNPFDVFSIEKASEDFCMGDLGTYPDIVPISGGGFTLSITDKESGRFDPYEVGVRPDPEKEGHWVLDCSLWWGGLAFARQAFLEAFSIVMAEAAYADLALPKPTPPHVHCTDQSAQGREYYMYHIPVNNHGCSGVEVTVRATSSIEGIVTDGSRCDSCWQSGGSGDGSSPIKIGSVVRLPDGWCWECASKDDLAFRESRDVSDNSRTAVIPEGLKIRALEKEDEE